MSNKYKLYFRINENIITTCDIDEVENRNTVIEFQNSVTECTNAIVCRISKVGNNLNII